MNDKVHALHSNASGFMNLLRRLIANELLVIMRHIMLSMPALLYTSNRHLNFYSSSNLWNSLTDRSCAFLPKSTFVRDSARFVVL